MKLNKKAPSIEKGLKNHPDLTTNEEGGIAFKVADEMDLMLRTVSSLVSENGFYKSGEVLDQELRESIHRVCAKNPLFVLQLAAYAREKMYLRTAPVVLAGEYAMSVGKGKVPNAKEYIAQIIQRPDEITELIAYVQAQNKARREFKGKIPLVVKRGVAEAFTKFNEYALAKYNRAGTVTLKDAVKMCHPKPNGSVQSDLFKRILTDTLATPNTWEVALSTKGASKETWEGVIPAMGYMALLRNLRNFEKHEVDLDPVIARLKDPKAIAKSKQFPYRFFSAYREVSDRDLLDALQDAMDISVQNIPDYQGTTFVACDNSGSMRNPVSEKSKIELIVVAGLFGAMVDAKCRGGSNKAIISVFGDTFEKVPLSSRTGILDNANKIMTTEVGCSTNAHLAIKYLREKKIHVDRIVIFSDMQCYNYTGWGSTASLASELKHYKRKVNKDVFTYSFDLAHYGTSQFPQDEDRVCLAGGFSDKILQFIPMFERSRADMLAEIKSISIE